MDRIQFQKENKTKNPPKTQLAKKKVFWKHNNKNGLLLQGKGLKIFVTELAFFQKKIAADHLPLLLDWSISFNLCLHTNFFIACCVEMPAPEYILFNYKMPEVL